MNRFQALALLVLYFVRDMLGSGWATARIILFRSRDLRPGFAEVGFDALSARGVHFVAALITLTPGTTTVDIDFERRVYVLHLLDLDQADQTVASIQQDFIRPAHALFGEDT